MKNLLLCFFLFVGIFVSSQNVADYEAIYKVQYLQDSTNLQSKMTEDRLSLLFNSDYSLFISTSKLVQDSAFNAMTNKLIQSASTKGDKMIIDVRGLPKVNFTSEVYRNKDDILLFKDIAKNTFFYHFPDKIEWKITDEKKQIGSHLCILAKGNFKGRKYDAWFAPDISIAEGPYIFKGLPGLVMEVYDQKKLYIFSLIGLQKSHQLIISPKGFQTTYDEFIHARNSFRSNPSALLEMQTDINISQEHRKRIYENINRFNNYMD